MKISAKDVYWDRYTPSSKKSYKSNSTILSCNKSQWNGSIISLIHVFHLFWNVLKRPQGSFYFWSNSLSVFFMREMRKVKTLRSIQIMRFSYLITSGISIINKIHFKYIFDNEKVELGKTLGKVPILIILY